MTPEVVGPEVVGIGAVNLDYIVPSSALGAAVDGRGVGLADRFLVGSERSISAVEAAELLEILNPFEPVFSPGGSALNTVASLAAANTGLAVGYVGLCGRVPKGGREGPSPDSPSPESLGRFSFPVWFDRLGINRDWLRFVDELPGTCVSATTDGQRSLLTTDGANAEIMAYLRAEIDGLVRYLSTARVVLITSFAGLDTIEPLVALVRRLRAEAPGVVVCCDPGAMWSAASAPTGVPELLSLVDWLLVNADEYAMLAYRFDLTDRAWPANIVVKHPEAVHVITDRSGAPSTVIHPNQNLIPADRIVDDTGTGDAFAAGLVWALAAPGVPVAAGVELGMRLAVEKLGWPGLAGLDRYASIAQPFLRS